MQANVLAGITSRMNLPLSCALCMVGMMASISMAAPRIAPPPDEQHAKAALNSSPRHGAFVDVPVQGSKIPLRCYIVFPERKDKAPVMIVIHEIFGLSDWVRGVADALAANGFIAIAPDLLSGRGKNGGGTESFGGRDDVMRAIRELKPAEVMKDLDAARAYALKLPAASEKSGCVGFCWGGGQSFAYAAHQPALNAAAVYYGTPPSAEAMSHIACPVMGFYGGNDARIALTVEPTQKQMQASGKTYTPHVYEGAGHGFLRAQQGQNGANQKAADQAWPATIEFLHAQLGQ